MMFHSCVHVPPSVVKVYTPPDDALSICLFFWLVPGCRLESFLDINPQQETVRSSADGKPRVMLLWRQVAHLSLPLILICQWRLSWRRRGGQREEDWGVFAPLLLHYGVIPLLKRKIRSSLNYLKPILHFTCLTGWGWGEVGRSQDRENLNKTFHAETLGLFHQFFFCLFF